MQAHVAKESKSEGSIEWIEFRMSKVRGVFCFGGGAEERRPFMAKEMRGVLVGGLSKPCVICMVLMAAR